MKALKKPGPHEQLHSLAPFTFDQALARVLAAKPQRKPKQKKPRRKKDR